MTREALVKPVRHLIMVLGDQLNRDASAFDGFDPKRDVVWMAEVAEESEHVWSHPQRIVIFLAAMRHFRDALQQEGIDVFYRQLDDPENRGSFAAELAEALKRNPPQRVIVTQPGEWRVQEALKVTSAEVNIPLEIREDRHFFCTIPEFAEHAKRYKVLRMEFFYREMRRKYDVLMQRDKPLGEKWNYDAENRGAFGKEGPRGVPQAKRFPPTDHVTAVLALVAGRFGHHPGSLESFDWPVTPEQAHAALEDFITHRLIGFGKFQDAMWTSAPFLYHSRLSAAMNLKLLNPRTVVAAAEAAHANGKISLSAVEGFIRQILGWREYVRGVYWLKMPDYLQLNALDAEHDLPAFYWTGETDMRCLKDAIGQTLKYAYAHHIQRLMITGLFALLYGVRPVEVHKWYLAVYIDAVEWVELPNTLGMSQFGDGGFLGSKPYAASGKYIQRMSNYCAHCPYNPAEATGEDACPFTTLYWDFLLRHKYRLDTNSRMSMQLRNLNNLTAEKKQAIRDQATALRGRLTP